MDNKTHKKEGRSVSIQPLTSELLTENMNILGVIFDIETDRLRVCLPNGLVGTVKRKNIFSKNIDQNISLYDIFEVGSIVTCQVKTDEVNDNEIMLSVKSKCVNSCLSKKNLQPGMLLLSTSVISKKEQGYVIDIGVQKTTAFLSNASAKMYVTTRNKGKDLQLGQIIPCVIKKISGKCVSVSCKPNLIDNAIASSDTAFRALIPGTRVNAVIRKVFKVGLVVHVNSKYDGVIRKENLQEWLSPSDYSVDAKIKGVVLFTEPISKVIYLSVDPRLRQPIISFPAVREGDLIKDAVLMKFDKRGAILKLKNKYMAICLKCNFSRKMNWFDETKQTCCVIGFNFMDNFIYVSMHPEHLSKKEADLNNIHMQPKQSKTLQKILNESKTSDQHPKRKRKQSLTKKEGINERGPDMKKPKTNKETIYTDGKKLKTKPVIEKVVSPKFLEVESDFKWTDTWDTKESEQLKDEDSSEDEVEDENKKKKGKKTKQDDNETELYELERTLADTNRKPQTEDDFDRLVASNPNSSLIWLQYMSFHLQNADPQRARAVADRALKTIGFREEQERLNMWVALLNLENLYGTEKSLSEILTKALQNNDVLKLYKHLIEIYRKSDKIEEAVQTYSTLLKKFKNDERISIEYITFLMENERQSEARQFFERRGGTKQIFQKQTELISKMAQLEFKCGDFELGRTHFENLLANHPKKINLWIVYIDQMTKRGNIDSARSLLERAITINGSARQMKSLFKKYLEFEKIHGDESSVNNIKNKIADYLSKNT